MKKWEEHYFHNEDKLVNEWRFTTFITTFHTAQYCYKSVIKCYDIFTQC